MKSGAGGEAKISKEVDRRASKNRKIRYVVHDKILNFLTPPLVSAGTQEKKEMLHTNLE